MRVLKPWVYPAAIFASVALGIGGVMVFDRVTDQTEPVARVIGADLRDNPETWRVDGRDATNGRWTVTESGDVCAGDRTVDGMVAAHEAAHPRTDLDSIARQYRHDNLTLFFMDVGRCRGDVELTFDSQMHLRDAAETVFDLGRLEAVREFEIETGIR